MNKYNLEEIVTLSNFDEAAYLESNPDVRKAVRMGLFKSGRHQFEMIGQHTGKRIRLKEGLAIIAEAKRRKHDRIKSILRDDLPCIEEWDRFDFLTDTLRQEYNIAETENVSGHVYSQDIDNLIERHANGLVLDCGAGRRPVYFENVVNYEIVPYDTTDVVGVGEVLPFVDGCFDAVISVAVLEHVKDPFTCANELVRVLKPGGDLICSVPFLQPLHAYPHHYYNMTPFGLKNLFDRSLTINSIKCEGGLRPIGSLCWILSRWAFGLTGNARQEFLNMRVMDLVNPPEMYFNRSFVKELPEQVNFELASACTLYAHKPPAPE